MRLSGTKTGAINQYRGLGNQLWDLAGNRPSLDLPFADNKSLVDATTGANLVDFTRASSGTYVDSEGVIRTATTNLLLRSEEFDQSPWGTIRSIITSNAVTSPNGSVTADKFIASTDPSTSHYVRQSVSLSAFQVYNFTVYAKAAEYGYLSITTFGSNGWSATTTSYFDLVNGVVTPSTTGIASIADVGNGWYRINHQATKGDTSGSSNIDIYVANSGSSVSFTGDGTSGIYLWGAQLEQSTTVGEYIPTTSTINSAPRFDHDPTTGESLGLLVEEQRTNIIPYSEDFSQPAWSTYGTVSKSSNVATAPDGNFTADSITIPAASGVFDNIAVSASTTYTFSVYIRGTPGTTIRILSNANSSGIVTNTVTVSGVWQRYSVTFTTNSGDNNTSIQFDTGGGNTFYVWGVQVEAGSFPTSYIPTTGATATRAADVASIAGSAFSSWYNQPEGTLFIDAASSQSTAAANVGIVVNDGTLSNRIELDVRSGSLGGAGRATITSGGSVSFDTGNSSSPAFVVNTSYRQAGAYKLDSFAYSLNGGFLQTDLLGEVPVAPDRAEIGARLVTGLPLNGTVKRISYWPARLPNETLQTITQ